MPTSPSIFNYHIGKGIVSFKRSGAGTFRDLGNCPSFVYTPAITKLDHFSSREGIKKKDASFNVQVGATIKFQMDEITPENLAFFALSDVDTNTAGDAELRGLSVTEFTGTIKVTGTNQVGQQVDFLGDVSFTPSGDFSFITDADNFTVLDVEAEVQIDVNGNFGVWTVRESVTA